jgi:hypothetical protein
MAETHDQENSGNISWQEFLIAHPPTQQSALSRIMIRAQKAELCISHGISAGLLSEVTAGAADFAEAMREAAEFDIQDPARQDEWKSRSLALADNANALQRASENAISRGEKAISREIVALYTRGIALEAACHSAFRIVQD